MEMPGIVVVVNSHPLLLTNSPLYIPWTLCMYICTYLYVMFIFIYAYQGAQRCLHGTLKSLTVTKLPFFGHAEN